MLKKRVEYIAILIFREAKMKQVELKNFEIIGGKMCAKKNQQELYEFLSVVDYFEMSDEGILVAKGKGEKFYNRFYDKRGHLICANKGTQSLFCGSYYAVRRADSKIGHFLKEENLEEKVRLSSPCFSKETLKDENGFCYYPIPYREIGEMAFVFDAHSNAFSMRRAKSQREVGKVLDYSYHKIDGKEYALVQQTNGKWTLYDAWGHQDLLIKNVNKIHKGSNGGFYLEDDEREIFPSAGPDFGALKLSMKKEQLLFFTVVIGLMGGVVCSSHLVGKELEQQKKQNQTPVIQQNSYLKLKQMKENELMK